ncbi:RHS repeat-associated core domain-containing protein [Nakamurella endophytica]|uniref:Type IV secretion protein Rhs n=1 Tax=Nakamurella endophytica TaxID=1748367 RepID=A0A917TC25_9ACTN|nr:RHS repeat-associated core domain-containing protein [Nakamurella endophytica]GGM17186.1 type IV secretion protein Rhs [Nakamurella endophytica]
MFPVLLDPSTTFGTGSDTGCYVTDPGTGTAPSDPQLCSTNSGTDNPLNYGVSAYTRRIYLRFGDVTTGSGAVIPKDATILNADLTMTEKTASSPTAIIDTGLYQSASAGAGVSTWWTNTASLTWASKPAYSPSVQQHLNVVPPGANQPFTYSITELARSWISGSGVNSGVVFKDYDESTASNTLSFYGVANTTYHPKLTVEWSPRVGQEKAVGTYDHKLTDRMDIHVGYATRNLVINGSDDQIAGPGLTATVRRTYNSVLAANGIGGAYGLGWSMSGGVDTGLVINPTSVIYLQPGGGREPFARQSTVPNESQVGAYASKTGLNADLIKTDATHYTLTWHSSQEVMTFTMPSGSATTAWLSSIKDRSGNTITYSASGSPLVTTALTDSTGQRSINFSYTSGRVTGMSETLAAGATGARSWSYGYDGSGHLTTYTDPASKVTTFCYTGNLVTRIITPRGVAAGSTCTAGTNGTGITDIAYDSAGKVTSISYRLASGTPNTVTFTATTPLNQGSAIAGVTTFTDPYGQQFTYTYDSSDRITKVATTTQGVTQTRSTTFNANSDATASISPNNYTTGGSNDPARTATYDSNNSLTQVTAESNATGVAGAVVSASYNTTGDVYRPISVSDDRDATTDGSGSSATSVAYDSTTGSGNLITTVTKGTSGNKTEIRHQGQSGVANCGPSGAAAYTGAVCETRDPDYTSGSAHRTLYSYNAMGEMVSMTPPAPGGSRTTPPAETFSYDGFSRLTRTTSSRSKTTGYTYDALDRLTRITYNDGHYTAFTYDNDGNKLTETDKTASNTVIKGETYTYDTMNRLTSEQPSGETAITMTYDANSRLLSYTDATGTTTFGYDPAGSLTSETMPGGSCAGFSETNLGTVASGCIIIGVDKSGNRKFIAYPGNLVREEYIYDVSGRILKLIGRNQSANPVYSTSYGYTNAAGKDTEHLFTKKDTIAGTTTSYTYTNQARLTSAVTKLDSNGTTTASEVFCYDANGNRTSYSTTTGATCPGTPTNGFDGANQLLTGTNTVGNYAYDLDGDETSSNTSLVGGAVRTSSWTDSQQTGSVTIGGTALSNSYLGNGNGYLYSTKTASGNTHLLRNSPLGVTEVDTFNGSAVTDQVNVRRDPGGAIFGFQTGAGDRYYPITDERGSIIYISDATGTTAAAYAYKTYGQQVITTPAPFNQPFGYLGAYTNPGTGLTHLSARYYDSTLGRFTQLDPSGKDDGYAYSAGDPINRGDTSGLYPCVAQSDPAEYDDPNNYDGCYEEGVPQDQEPTGAQAEGFAEGAGGCVTAAVAANESGITELAGLLFGPIGAGAVDIVSCAAGFYTGYSGGGQLGGP